MNVRIRSFVMLAGPLLTATATAQIPATSPARTAAAQALDPAPVPPSNYVYESEGRRDPFVSLASPATQGRAPQGSGIRPDGIAGVMVNELVVRGVVQSRGGWMAIVAGANGRAYSLRAGDRLMDGTVSSITLEAVVLMQDVNDPLSLTKHREVRKYLRGEVR